MAALHRALDLGVNFFDTADVYGDGHSERLLAKLRKERQEPFYVATKAGRRIDPQTAAGYKRQNLTAFIERSLKNLEAGQPRPAATALPAHARSIICRRCSRFLDDLVKAGKLRHYGVSVEKVEEALKAIEFPNVQDGADYFQYFPPATQRVVFPEAQFAARSASWRGCRCHRECWRAR